MGGINARVVTKASLFLARKRHVWVQRPRRGSHLGVAVVICHLPPSTTTHGYSTYSNQIIQKDKQPASHIHKYYSQSLRAPRIFPTSVRPTRVTD
jgi:hypothetical protein